MPGALEIDFTKVKRKIRSVPGSPKHSPGSGKSHRFIRKTKQKVIAVSTPCTPVSGSRLDLRQFLSGDRRGISISVSDDESEKSSGSNKKLRSSGCSEELQISARKICGDELLNLGRSAEAGGAKVCVVLNDDELLLVSFS